MNWPLVQTGEPAPPEVQATFHSGNGLMRPLEAAARRLGVQILLEHNKMTAIHRQRANSGRVVGIVVDSKGAKLNIQPWPESAMHTMAAARSGQFSMLTLWRARNGM